MTNIHPDVFLPVVKMPCTHTDPLLVIIELLRLFLFNITFITSDRKMYGLATVMEKLRFERKFNE